MVTWQSEHTHTHTKKKKRGGGSLLWLETYPKICWLLGIVTHPHLTARLFWIPWKDTHVSSPMVTSHNRFELLGPNMLSSFFKHRTFFFWSFVSRSGIHPANIFFFLGGYHYVGFFPLFPWINHTLNMFLIIRMEVFSSFVLFTQRKVRSFRSVHGRQSLGSLSRHLSHHQNPL